MTKDFVEVSGGKRKAEVWRYLPQGYLPFCKIVRVEFAIEHLEEVKFLYREIVSSNNFWGLFWETLNTL